MSERDAFLKALAENEDDTTTRLVYADWLDDRGEHEEADRMRKWDAAKAWLVKFCRVNNKYPDDEWVISYETLLGLGLEAVQRIASAGDTELWFSCGNNMRMCDALRANPRKFWQNWSIVTGIPVPADAAEKSGFSCAC